MAAERAKREPRPRSGTQHKKWKTTAMYAGRDGPARPAVRGWLARFLVDAFF